MGHCKDCKYWAEMEGFAGRVCLRAGTPGASMSIGELGEYSHGPQLVTEPGFGCAMFCAPATHCSQCRSKLGALRCGDDRAYDLEFCSIECVEAWSAQCTCLPGTVLGHLKDGTPVYYGMEPAPRVAIVGVQRDPNAPEPLTIRTREEYKAHFGYYPSRSMFPETEPVTMVPVVDGDPASRLPCSCSRCGKEATLLHAFENTAGTEVYCGYDCYRAAGGEA